MLNWIINLSLHKIRDDTVIGLLLSILTNLVLLNEDTTVLFQDGLVMKWGNISLSLP